MWYRGTISLVGNISDYREGIAGVKTYLSLEALSLAGNSDVTIETLLLAGCKRRRFDLVNSRDLLNAFNISDFVFWLRISSSAYVDFRCWPLFWTFEVVLDSSREDLSSYTLLGGCSLLERDHEVAVLGRFNQISRTPCCGNRCTELRYGLSLLQREIWHGLRISSSAYVDFRCWLVSAFCCSADVNAGQSSCSVEQRRRHFGLTRGTQLWASGSLPHFEHTPVATVCCRLCGAMFGFLGSLFGCSLQLLSGVSFIASAFYLMLFFSYFSCSPYWGLTPCPSGAWFVFLAYCVVQVIQLVAELTRLEVPQVVVRVSK
ncbi:hypothetical protein F511_16194 [Dorcoceras hygrometricum]|uniref:Uncharacterized protein n=1 Tax=Dorcoceras hygrometricum TaxID=472368 RepID=A0A2Z7CK81_9LAMI|nr:hypothetical protein F511_16194 [Dorcoceras hygrometricum]